jgi:hypothetical protein
MQSIVEVLCGAPGASAGETADVVSRDTAAVGANLTIGGGGEREEMLSASLLCVAILISAAVSAWASDAHAAPGSVVRLQGQVRSNVISSIC